MKLQSPRLRVRALEALANSDCGWFYRCDASKFEVIPGSPIAYWVSNKLLKAFDTGKPLASISVARDGIHTCNNERFLRRWWEVSQKKTSLPTDKTANKFSNKWIAYNKGGNYRKWRGNNEYVINWEDDGRELKSSEKAHGFNGPYAYAPSVTWSSISSGKPAFRNKPSGFMFDAAGYSMFPSGGIDIDVLCAFANSSVAEEMLSFLSPTLNYQAGDVLSMVVLDFTAQAVSIKKIIASLYFDSQCDWDSFEESWDFKKHPLL